MSKSDSKKSSRLRGFLTNLGFIATLCMLLFVLGVSLYFLATTYQSVSAKIEPKEVVATPSPAATVKPSPSISPTPSPTPVVLDSYELPQTAPVSSAYLDDTVFLGDSRTSGMVQFGLIPEENAFSKVGINHIDFLTTQFTDIRSGYTSTIANLLKSRKPKRIYIELGVNGVGFMGTEEFMSHYQNLITVIRGSSPDSTLVITAILPIGRDGLNSNGLTNANIDTMNERLIELAEAEDCYFLDASKDMKGTDNLLKPEYNSGDDLHYNEEGYRAFLDEILSHPVPDYEEEDISPSPSKTPYR